MTFQEFAEIYLIPAQLAFAMFGMGATLRVVDFIDVFREPKGLTLGLVLQMIGVPLIAFGLATAFDMSPGWAVGLLLVSVVPGGAFSNLFTFLGRGNTALSIAMTVAATVSSIATIPLVLSILAPAHLPPGFELPAGEIVFDIFAWLLTPLVAGMILYRAVNEETAATVAKWVVRISLVLLAVVVISTMTAGRIEMSEYGWEPPLRIVLFGAIIAIVLPFICRLFGQYDDDTLAIAVEVCIRNVSVGLLIVPFFFAGQAAQGHVFFTVLFYSAVSGCFAFPLLFFHRIGWSVVAFRPPLRREDHEGRVPRIGAAKVPDG